MGKQATVFNQPKDNAEDARRDAIARAELDAGQGVPHEHVREWLAKLAKGERLPPPKT